MSIKSSCFPPPKPAPLIGPARFQQEGCSDHDLREDAVWFMTGRGMDVLEYVSRDRVHSSSPPATSTRSNGSLSPFTPAPTNLQASAPEGATATEIDTECTFLTGMEKRLISTQAEVAGGPDRQKTPGLQAGWSLKS